MDHAEKDFGIPPVIDAQDFAAEKPDERSVMMYLSYFVGTASGPGPGQGVLLKWITEQIPNQRVANLTSDWQDGRVLGALTNAVSGGKFTTFEEMSPEKGLHNVEQSMIAAEKMLKVRRIMKVNEFADPQLNGILRLSYLSQFYHAMVSDNAPFLIPPAPDKVEVSQVQVPESVGDGKHVCVQLDCSDAGHGAPKAEVVGRKVGSVVHKIERFGTDKYKVKFVPPEVDVYKLSIFYGDGVNHMHVTGSPFAVNLHPPDPEGVKHIDTANPNEDVEHVSMTFNTKEAGRGKLKAKATGEIVGSVPIKINIESEGTYVITFIPPTADVYMVDVLWGKFSAHATGKVCGSIPLDIDGDIRECEVSFKPPSPDVYTVDVNWEEKPVPGSPFKINHQPPPQPEKVVWTDIYYTTPGMDAILIVDLSNAGSGELTAECVGKICGKVDVEVKKVEGRTFQLTFNPPKEDLYTLSIKFHDIHIERSPFEIDMRSKRVIEYVITTDHKSNELVENTIHKDELTMLVGQLLIVNVRVQDAHQQEGNLDVFVNGSATDKVEIERLDGGMFIVEFKPDKPDHYTLKMKYNGKQKGLIKVHCIRLPTLIAMTSDLKQDDEVCYKIDLEGLESSKVSAKCTGEDNKEVKVEISRDTTDTKKCMYNITFTPPKPSRYTLSVSYDKHEIWNSPATINIPKSKDAPVYFNPDKPDHYVMNVQLNGENVPKSPFYIHYTPAPDPVMTSLPDTVFKTGQPVGYDIDLTGLDAGKLSANCVGDDVGEVEVNIVQDSNDPKKNKINFVPPKPDLYKLSVFYNNAEVKHSPYIIDLRKKVEEVIDMNWQYDKDVEASLSFEDLEEEVEEPVVLEELPMEEFTNFVGTPTLVKIKPSSAAERYGTVVATAIGNKSGHTRVKSSKQPNDDFIVSLNPQHPDRYTVDILLNDAPVPRSPFIINYIMPPTDPSQCKIIDVEEIPSYVEVGHEVTVHVDAKKAGPGDLDVSADRPKAESDENPSMLAASLAPGVKGIYEVTYIPNSVGYHKLNFLWANEKISQSPVQTLAYDPAKVEVHPHGKPVGVDLATDVKQGDLRAHIIHKRTNTHHKVKISKVQRGKYRFTFSPKVPGLYFLHIFAKDKELPESPFPIRYARPAKPEACVVIGLVDKCYLGETLKFIVDATRAGDGDLQIKCDRKDKGKVNFTEDTNATYSVEFTPTAPGTEKLYITWGGRPVPDSPHSLFIKDHAEEELITWLFLIDRANEHQSVDFPENELTASMAETLLLRIMARTDEQKKGEPIVTATDLSTNKREKVAVSKRGEDIFEATFLPDVPRTYSISAQLNGEQVPNTPFIVNYTTAPPVAANCKIVGLELLPPYFQVDRPINFQIDTRLAGDGKLNIAADCPQVKPKLEAKPSRDDSRIIDIEYVPTAPGSHNLKLAWSGEPIPKSPLAFEVEDIKLYPNGKPVAIDLDVDGKSSELEAHGIHIDSNTRIKVKINKVAKGKFNFNLRPKLPGLYALHILLKKKEISSSPIYFRYDFPPKPEAVVIRDVPEECYLLEPYTFTVDATQAGTADLKVKLTPPSKGKDGELTITDNKDGTHSVQHVPEAIGSHSFDLTWDGKPVPESPVKVMVNKRVPVVKHSFGPYINLVPVGQTVYLKVVNVGKHEKSTFFDVQVSAPDNDDKATIEKLEDDNYSVKFVPSEPKDYNLTVKLHGETIQGSPVFVKAVEPACLEMDFDHPTGICHSDVEAGQPVCLLIPRDESLPADTLSVETKGPFGPCETNVCDSLENMYGLNFTPVFPGEYLVHVKPNQESANEIEKSPFKIVAAKKESAAQKVFIPEEYAPVFADPIPLGAALNFDIDTKDAGYGTLKVRPQGAGQAGIRLYDKDDGVYGCEVKPREEGHCQLDILWKDESIRNSPFLLHFCKVKGVDLEGEKFQTGSPYKFQVKCSQVLDGQFEVTCSDQTAAEISITHLADQKAYECVMIPSQVGDYQVSVMYNGYHIEGSPFNVDFHSPPKTGVSFSLNAEGGETSDISATVQSAINLQELPVQLSQLFGGQYSLEFVPTQGLEYMVTIKCRVKIAAEEKEVAGSPFSLSYVKEQVDASKCVLEFEEGTAGKAVAGVQSSFFVISKGAGHGQLNVKIDGPDGKPDVTVRQVSPSKAEVKYVLHRSGNYRIAVTWDGEPIPGSPFEVQCNNPEGMVSLFGEPKFPSEVVYGQPLCFSLMPKVEEEQREGSELVVLARSKLHGITPGTVEQRGGTYECTVDLKHRGQYKVEVTWNGNPIEGTPFDVRVIQTPEPEKVYVKGPGLKDGYLGQQGNFTIDTTEGGSGTLSVNVEGPKGGFKVNLSRHPENERVIIADYNPQNAGQYIINVLWSNVSVSGSPFTVNINEQPDEPQT